MNGSAVATEAVPAPSGYVELFERDEPYIHKLVRRELGSAATPEDVEDAAQYICERLVTRNVLAMYDPQDPSGASWHTFLGRQVILYCRGLRENNGKRAWREPAQVDAPAGDGHARWLDLYAPGEWDDYPALDSGELVTRLRAWLAAVPASWQPSGPVKLAELFEQAVTAAQDGERPRISRAGMIALRRALQPALARPVRLPMAGPPGYIAVTREDVGQAITVLEGSKKGTAVKQPLAKAGSLLAAMDYHAVAAAERHVYPKLRSAGGSRAEHTGHVKAAVLHCLYRLLAEEFAPDSEPEPEPTVAERFEAELWHFPGMTPEKVDQLKDMARELAGEEDDNAG